MLYESLAGKRPFTGTAIEILTRKGIEDAPTLIGQEGIPADLAELAMQLLARKPEERPSSLKIAGMISANLPISTSSKSGEQILVGRDTHLQSMQQAYDAFASKKEATSLFVEGRSGEGKTTLVEHFLNSLRRSTKAVVLSGRCYDRESVPLKALDSLIDPLCNWLRSQHDDAAAYLPDDIHMLAHLFPVMRRVDIVATAAARPVGRIDMKQVRHRAFVALREMLHRISQEHPVLLFIDDLQWGDADSAGAIFELFKPPDPPAVMLLGTYRSDEADAAPFLQSWRERRGGKIADHLVTLSPLSLEECVELVVARLGEDSESIRQRVAIGVFRSQWILNQETVGCMPVLARALRSHAESLRATDQRQSKQLFRRAKRVARRATRFTHFLRLEHPFAFREYSLALAAAGRLRKAHKLAAKSCQVAEKQQAVYELAQSRLVKAQLSQQLGHSDAGAQIEAAQAALADFQRMIVSVSNDGEIQSAEATDG